MIQKLFTQESKTITGAALIIGISAVLSRVLGLIRDRLLVSRFGVANDLDAYYAAFQIPNMLFALLVLGTLSVAFIPVFSEYLAKGKRQEAWRIANTVLTVTTLGMAFLCAVLIAAAPLLARLVAPGFEGEKLELTVRLTRIMMLSPLSFSISAVLSSVLNSFKQFLSVSLAPLLYNASIIFGILFLTGPFGVAGVAYGAILGAVLHILIQLPALSALGMRFRPAFDAGHAGVREIGRLFLPRVFGVDISQISVFIGSIVGSTLGAGAVALYNLSMNVAVVPIGIIAIPFAIAAFPTLSEAGAIRDRRAFVQTFAATFRQILFFLIPLAALAIVLRLHVIRVVLGAGTLSWAETRLAAASLGLFMLSLVFQGLTPLLARAFYALKNTLTPVLVSGVSVAMYLATTYVGIWWLDASKGGGNNFLRLPLGLYGVDDMRVLALPAAFSAASAIQVLLLVVILRKRFGPIGGTGVLRAFVKFFAGAVAAAIAARLTVGQTGNAFDTTTFLGVLFQAVSATLVGLTSYVLVLRLLKSEELAAVAGSFKKRMMKLEKPMAIHETQEM